MSEENESKQPTQAASVLKGLVRPLPCPFCGGENVAVHEGTSFRWRYAGCEECGASAGEVRIQTCGEGTHEEWESEARNRAIEEWNTRAEEPVTAGSECSAGLGADVYELRAALGTMLSTWDEATKRMVAFMKDSNKETAAAYSEMMPRMFEAAALARAVYQKREGKRICTQH